MNEGINPKLFQSAIIQDAGHIEGSRSICQSFSLRKFLELQQHAEQGAKEPSVITSHSTPLRLEGPSLHETTQTTTQTKAVLFQAQLPKADFVDENTFTHMGYTWEFLRTQLYKNRERINSIFESLTSEPIASRKTSQKYTQKLTRFEKTMNSPRSVGVVSGTTAGSVGSSVGFSSEELSDEAIQRSVEVASNKRQLKQAPCPDPKEPIWGHPVYQEFKLRPETMHHLIFFWKSQAQYVEVAGSFTTPPWAVRRPLFWCPVGGFHWIDIHEVIPNISGHHHFKYIVNGSWMCDSTFPISDDGQGNLNNVVVIFPEALKRVTSHRRFKQSCLMRLHVSSPSLYYRNLDASIDQSVAFPTTQPENAGRWHVNQVRITEATNGRKSLKDFRTYRGPQKMSSRMFVISKDDRRKDSSRSTPSIQVSSSPDFENMWYHDSKQSFLSKPNTRKPAEKTQEMLNASKLKRSKAQGDFIALKETNGNSTRCPSQPQMTRNAGSRKNNSLHGSNEQNPAEFQEAIFEEDHSDEELTLRTGRLSRCRSAYQPAMESETANDAIRRVASMSVELWPPTVTEHLHSPDLLLELNFPDLRERKNLCLNAGAALIPHPKKKQGADSLFICDAGNAIGVADGVGEWDCWGLNPRKFAEELMSGCCSAAESEECKAIGDPEVRCATVVKIGYDSTSSFGSATALVASLNSQEGALGVANLGDSTLMVLRRSKVSGMTYILRTKEQQHQFNCPYQLSRLPSSSQFQSLLDQGKDALVRVLKSSTILPQDTPELAQTTRVQVMEGDLVIAGTDGLFDNVYDHEICALANLTLSPYEALLLMETHMVTPPYVIASALAEAASFRSRDPKAKTPFMRNARTAGTQYYGGKLDDITVVACWVTRIQ